MDSGPTDEVDRVRLYEFDGRVVIAAHSLDESHELFEAIYNRKCVFVSELDTVLMKRQHRRVSPHGREWCGMPAYSKETYLDALGRDLIEGREVPFVFRDDDE